MGDGGKGSAPRKVRDDEAYASNWDKIFGSKGKSNEHKWVGLTRTELIRCGVLPFGLSYELYEAIEAKLREKNA